MARRLIVEIVGDASSFQRSLKTAEKSTTGFAKKTTSVGSRLAKAGIFAGAAAGLGALTAATKMGVDEFVEAQKVGAQTNAVIKSTGGAANVTATHVDRLAERIQAYSGMDDEAIASGENLLLTFKNVRNETGRGRDIFDQATVALADMSTALGQDTKTSAMQLGKALQDPVKGVGRLTRVGVTFSVEQKKMIKALAATGDMAGAQRIILAELRSEFGGSARAAGETLAGKLNILRGTFENLAGKIVTMVMPAFTKLVDRATKWITNVQNQRKVMDTAREVFKTVVRVLKVLQGAFETLSKIVGGNANAIKLLVAAYATFKILTIASSVTKLAGSFGLLAGRTGAATAATRGLSASMLGKAGLVAAVGALSYELSTAIFKATGLDNKFKSMGGSIRDLADRLGLTSNAMQEFEGTTAPTAAVAGAVKTQAGRLFAHGATASQVMAQVAATQPGLARHDIEVLVGLAARRQAAARGGGGMNVHIENFHSAAQNPRELQDALTKTHRGRPVRRRGDP